MPLLRCSEHRFAHSYKCGGNRFPNDGLDNHTVDVDVDRLTLLAWAKDGMIVNPHAGAQPIRWAPTVFLRDYTVWRHSPLPSKVLW